MSLKAQCFHLQTQPAPPLGKDSAAMETLAILQQNRKPRPKAALAPPGGLAQQRAGLATQEPKQRLQTACLFLLKVTKT